MSVHISRKIMDQFYYLASYYDLFPVKNISDLYPHLCFVQYLMVQVVSGMFSYCQSNTKILFSGMLYGIELLYDKYRR